jgi:hypothetical protein
MVQQQINGVGKVIIENSMLTCDFTLDKDAFMHHFSDLMNKLSASDMAALNSAIYTKKPVKVKNEAILVDFFAKVADRKKPK